MGFLIWDNLVVTEIDVFLPELYRFKKEYMRVVIVNNQLVIKVDLLELQINDFELQINDLHLQIVNL